MPCTPISERDSRTSSSLNGLITAVTNFIDLLPLDGLPWGTGQVYAELKPFKIGLCTCRRDKADTFRVSPDAAAALQKFCQLRFFFFYQLDSRFQLYPTRDRPPCGAPSWCNRYSPVRQDRASDPASAVGPPC